MSKEENIRKILGMTMDDLGLEKPRPVVKKVYPSIKEFMQKTASDWMKHGFPDERHEHTFKNSGGRRCRIKFEIDILN